MNNHFEILMEQIKMPDEVRNSALFQTAEVKKVTVHRLSRHWDFELIFDTILPLNQYSLLSGLIEQAFAGIATVSLEIEPRQSDFELTALNAYYHYIFEAHLLGEGAFSGLFSAFQFEEENKQPVLKIQALSTLERFEKNDFPRVERLIQSFGFKDFSFLYKIDDQLTADSLSAHEFEVQQMMDEALKAQAQVEAFKAQRPAKTSKTAFPKSVSADKQDSASKTEITDLKIGRDIKATEPITPMNTVMGQEQGVVFEGYIYQALHASGVNRTTKKEWHRLELGLTDYTTSFKVTKFGSKPVDIKIFDKICENYDQDAKKTVHLPKSGGNGLWVRAQGNLVMGQYDKEPTLDLKNLQVIAPKNIREDNAPEDKKRVEFHTHTNMSQMDAIPAPADLVAQAAKFGHKAIAITDHAGVQAFPEAHAAGKKYGVKIIYGLEANLVDDFTPIVYNESTCDMHDATYVVFDLETTGLSARYNQIIQIAATKMHKGNPIGSFNEFINPGHPISSFTTELTSITDDMVQDAKPLKQVLKEFQVFCQNTILVAHNARFDMGFMNMNYSNNGLSLITQPVIDTLEFARNLYPEMRRHGLGPLTKKFNVILDHHHLADQDAESTGRLLFIFLEEVRNAHKRLPLPEGEYYKMEEPASHAALTDLLELNETLVAPDNYKKQRPYHATLYAQTQEGLKNLFKIVSYSNVKYFSGVPRILRSTLIEHRAGLLIGSACEQGEVFDAVINKSIDEATQIAEFYDFIEIQPPALYYPLLVGGTFNSEKEQQKAMTALLEIAKRLSKPVLATGNVHTINPEDAIYREIVVRSLGQGAEINRTLGHGEGAQPLPLPAAYFRTTDEMLKEFSFLGADTAYQIVVKNTQELAEKFDTLTPVRDDLYTPVMTFEGGEGSEERTARLTYERAHIIYGNPLPEAIDARLEKELRSIIGNGFSVIYLIAQELVHRSNQRGYLVGSRGSVGSSLVATMIGITEVNPLPPHYICPNPECRHFEIYDDGSYGSGFDMPDKNCPDCGTKLRKDGQDIPFETFLGFKGDKVPDIDLNFSGDDQPYAHLDVRDIFGEDYAFRAGTIATVADKTAYGYVLGYERDYGKYYRNAEKDRLAAGATGVKRTTGQHPGGIIVIPNYMDVYDFSPVQYPADKTDAEWQTTHFDFHAIHDNILKLDILGHDDPTMIRKLQSLSGIEPETIPMDDAEVLKLFSSTESLGITQEQAMSKLGTFGVPEMGTFTSMNMIADAKPKTFADLLQISGLSHGTDVWAGNAQDLIKQGIATLSTVIGCRDDIMVYLIHKGLDESMAFTIMERVRKGAWAKLPDDERDKYIDAMKAHEVPQWYIDSCAKIKYMFPKAHAVAYIMMALRVAWFKVHRPMDYYAAWFSIRAGAYDIELMSGPLPAIKNKINDIRTRANNRENRPTPRELELQITLELVNEMRERGFNFGKLDLYESDATDFIIEGNTLVPPFVIMDSLGDTVANSILEARKNGEFLSKNELKQRTGLNQTNVEDMTRMGILDGMPEDNQLSLFDM